MANGVRVSRPVQDRRALRLPTHRRQKSAADAARNPGVKKRRRSTRRWVRLQCELLNPVAELAATSGLFSWSRHASRCGFVPCVSLWDATGVGLAIASIVPHLQLKSPACAKGIFHTIDVYKLLVAQIVELYAGRDASCCINLRPDQ